MDLMMCRVISCENTIETTIDMKIPDLIVWLKVNADTKLDDNENALLQAGDIIQRAHEWYTMSAEQMRLHCGEMTPDEVLTVRAVLSNILVDGKYDSHNRRPQRKQH